MCVWTHLFDVCVCVLLLTNSVCMLFIDKAASKMHVLTSAQTLFFLHRNLQQSAFNHNRDSTMKPHEREHCQQRITKK